MGFVTKKDLQEIKDELEKDTKSIFYYSRLGTIYGVDPEYKVRTIRGQVGVLENKMEELYKKLGFNFVEKECKINFIKKVKKSK
jgi:hypothetical protein